MKHSLQISNWKKLAAVAVGFLCLGTTAMAQTQIGVTGTQVFASKVYDGNTNCGVYLVGNITGVSYLHNVLVTATAQYMDRHVGDNKPVVVSYAISGADAALYLAPANDTLTASITPRSLSITGTQVAPKTYDKLTNASIFSFGTLHGVLSIDSGNIYPACLANFQNPNAGRQPVDVTYSLVATGSSQAADYIAPLPETLMANILPRTAYTEDIAVAAEKVYDGFVACPVSNYGHLTGLLDDDTVHYSVTANFRSRHAGMLKAVDVNIFTSGPQAANYNVVDTFRHYSRILPLEIEWYRPTVQLAKEYDGTADAIVLVNGGADNILPIDTVVVETPAYYDSPEVGRNKVISCDYVLSGPQAANYACSYGSVIITNEGKIILPTRIATLGTEEEPFMVTATGFCQGTNAGVRYQIAAGEPTSYQVTFSGDAIAQGFANTGWMSRGEQDSVILFQVPATCQEGDYTCYLSFKNDAGVSTNPLPATFHVNIPNSYLVQVFDDVVSIDNSGKLDGRIDRFNSFQWYHNGEEINDTKPYHQEIGGLTGEYSVRVNMGLSDEGYVCPKAFTSSSKVSIVHVYPSPVVSNTNIKLQGFHDGEHLMQVFDNHGTVVFSTTFSGFEYKLDMSTLAPGSYLINVDGRTAKTIKM